MSRYTIEDLYNDTCYIQGHDSTTPFGLVGAIYFKDDPETERLKRWIEAHDEVMNVLREALDVVRDWASTEAYEQIDSKIQTLIVRIEGGGRGGDMRSKQRAKQRAEELRLILALDRKRQQQRTRPEEPAIEEQIENIGDSNELNSHEKTDSKANELLARIEGEEDL